MRAELHFVPRRIVGCVEVGNESAVLSSGLLLGDDFGQFVMLVLRRRRQTARPRTRCLGSAPSWPFAPHRPAERRAPRRKSMTRSGGEDFGRASGARTPTGRVSSASPGRRQKQSERRHAGRASVFHPVCETRSRGTVAEDGSLHPAGGRPAQE